MSDTKWCYRCRMRTRHKEGVCEACPRRECSEGEVIANLLANGMNHAMAAWLASVDRLAWEAAHGFGPGESRVRGDR